MLDEQLYPTEPRQTVEGENVIPPAIRRQGERADQLLREIGATGVPQPTPAPEPTLADPPLIAAAPEPTPVVEPPAQPAQPPVQTDDATWEQRFRSLDGRFEAFRAEANARTRAAEQRAAQLENLIAQMNTSAAAAGRAPTIAGAEPRPTAPPKEDVEQWGEDLINSTRRWARMEVNSELEQLRAQVAQLSSAQTNVGQQIQQQTAVQQMDAQFPNWRAVNDDPKFLEWLQNFDPFSGQKRHDMLRAAFAGGDIPRTLAFFHAFTNGHTEPTDPRPAPVHTAPAADRVPLEAMAAPGRGRPSSPGAPNAKPNFTQRQIAAFYTSIAKGEWANREAARAQREAEIFAAVAEGRVH